MYQVFRISLQSILRDRVFHGVLFIAFLFALIPTVASLSMRQAVELSITLSLSLVSFMLLILAVFLGGTSIWRDIDRRYTYSILSLPISRATYLVGRFLGVAFFLLCIGLILGGLAVGAILATSFIYPPDRPVHWDYLAVSLIFICLKYVLLTACAFVLSTFSTSFFLPVFGTISTYFIGSFLQQAYAYVNSSAGREFSAFLKGVVSALYYLLPNLGAFDFRTSAIYGIPPQPGGVLLTIAYFLTYTSILMTAAAIVFRKREIK